MKDPVLSICCITYNHKDYISKAIEGFLMQKTKFKFEILIYDDGSNDGSQQIIRDYQQKFPELIKPILQEENKYSQGERGMNFRYNYPRAQGKYIAICDGDDFWTDQNKLQIQVDFLENNPEYILTFHNSAEIDEDDIVHEIPLLNQYKTDKSALDLKRGAYVFASTICYRNVLRNFPKEVFNVVNEDTFTISLLGASGKAKYLSNIGIGYYRIQKNGVWSTLKQEQRAFHKITTYKNLISYYNRINDIDMVFYFNDRLRNVYLGLLEHNFSLKYFRSIYRFSSDGYILTSWLLLKSIIKSFFNITKIKSKLKNG